MKKKLIFSTLSIMQSRRQRRQRRGGNHEHGMYSRNKSKGVMSFLRGMKSTAKSAAKSVMNAPKNMSAYLADMKAESDYRRHGQYGFSPKGGRRSRRR
jgi:hypothetical protein